jgi:hypothetical protein
MANRELISKGSDNQTIKIDSKDFKILIQELIRLDVPILEVGSSSIGKSYSVRQFAEECGVNSEFLFVGTEKSEFIEGIPNLKGIDGDTAKFTYLKPYWFPDQKEIRSRLIKGKSELESLLTTDGNINSLYQKIFTGVGDYKVVNDLKIAVQGYKRTEAEVKSAKKEGKVSKYIYVDVLLYLSTMQGFGNFWLILDEIDKVEKQDKDKYAPLLHIVRERELKGWKLSGMREYPEYDIKFVNSIILRKERLDAALLDPNVDVTDTRIIAIANDLQVMEKEAPALYRRFVKIIIDASLYDERKITLPSGDPNVPVGYDWAKQFEVERQNLHNCIVVKEIPVEGASTSDSGLEAQKKGKKATQTESIGDKMAEIDPEKCGKPLEEMNLQWTLGFFPDILFPGKDSSNQGEGFLSNDIITNYNKSDNPYQTLIFKILSDNFDSRYWKPMLTCVHDQISTKMTDVSKEQERSDEVSMYYAEAGIKLTDLNNPSPSAVGSMVERYAKKMASSEAKFKESIDIQLGLTAGTEETVGLAQTLLKRAFDAIKFGYDLIDMSLEGGKKPTVLTKMLFSAIPFIQTKVVSNSPYIPYDGTIELNDVQDDGIINLLQKISGDDFDTDIKAKDASVKVFAMLEPYRPFIVKYAVGIPSDMVETIADGGYDKITDVNALVNSIIENRPVIVDNIIVAKIKDDKLKMKYFNSISNVKLIEKEMYRNIPGVVAPLLINDYDQNGLTEELKGNISYYTEKFPNTMNLIAAAPKTPAELGDFITDSVANVLANPSDFMISESDLIKG